MSTPLNPANRAARFAYILPVLIFRVMVGLVMVGLVMVGLVMVGLAMFGGTAQAADWNAAEQQLAGKVVAVTGPGAVAITIENRSSLGRRDCEIIQNGLRNELAALGLHFVKADQAAANVTISLSENVTSYVWVAQIRQGAGESSVVMVSLARPQGSVTARDTVPMTLRKTLIWAQDSAILDVAVLEENGATAVHIGVLDVEGVSLYRWQGGKWQQEQSLAVTHSRSWPRDLRGRLIPARDHLFDVYLPGSFCQSSAAVPLTLNCRDSDDPWPLLPGTLNGAMASFPSAGLGNGATMLVPQEHAFFAPSRNFSTGALAPPVGKFSTVAKFYSAAVLPRDKYALWVFAGVDGQVHLVDGISDQSARFGWGSNVAGVRTACGAGWQVLAASVSDSNDSVRAYEFPDRDPVAVTAAVDFSGPITAFWTEASGDTAVAVARNRDTGNYEAFRLAMACSQ